MGVGVGVVALRWGNSAELGVVCAVFPEAKCRTPAIQEVKAGGLCVQSRCCLQVAMMVRVHAPMCSYVHDCVCVGQGINLAASPHLVS